MTIELVKVVKRFHRFTVGPLSFKVSDDNILVIIGPTGNGKTTILNLIAGLIKPESGTILLDGIDITNMPIESRNIGYSFQRPNLFPHLNVYQNIIFGIKKKDKKNKQPQVKNLVENLNISHLLQRRIQGLSGGEMQKVSLARTLIVEPKLMLMDEPLSSLDDPSKKKLRGEIRQILKRQKIPCIYVTHFEDDVYALADYVAILKDGCIETIEKLETLLVQSNNIELFASSFSSKVLGGSGDGDGGYNYIEGKVIESKNGVTIIGFGNHIIEILGEYSIGSTIGVLIKPEDIILTTQLVKTSARNIIKTKVTKIKDTNKISKKGVLDIYLSIEKNYQLNDNGKDNDNYNKDIYLVSRITKESRIYLGIKEGDYIFAMFKATSPQVIRERK
jgi:ABC-type Fe3+/spermidine/putrescine transport system ATPase subunit